MEESNLLTTFKKYIFVIFIGSLVIILAGCGQDFTPIDESSTGFFNQYFVYPFSLLIKGAANMLGGSYGGAIILITIAIRLVLMPFFIRQAKNGEKSKEKMAVIMPEMKKIQEKYQGKKSTEDQVAMQKELSELYQEHNYNPIQMATGCLPLFLQMPFLIGFFYAIRRTPEIAEQTFLWFSLGEMNLLLVLIAVIVYFIQARVSLLGLDEAQRKQMAIMGLISPVMIGIISLNVPAALPLYWTVSGLFMIGQTLVIKRMVQ